MRTILQAMTTRIGTLSLGVGLLIPACAYGAPSVRMANDDHRHATDDGKRQMRLTIDLSPRATERDTSMALTTNAGSLPSEAMLHHFHVVASDTAGLPLGVNATWEATILVQNNRGAASLRRLVSLTSASPDFSLPRPLGYQLETGDSLFFVATRGGQRMSTPIHLELLVDFDVTTTCRLSVIPLPATEVTHPLGTLGGGTNADIPVTIWSWTPTVDGRILAIAGSALENGGELSLEDVTTGERLWGTTQRDAHGEQSYRASGSVVRLGAQVKRGHEYRLTATLSSSSTEVAKRGQSGDVLALVLPVAR